MSETGSFHETGEAFYTKDGFEPRVAVTPSEKVNLEAAGWVVSTKTPKTAVRATTRKATTKSTGKAGTTSTSTPAVEPTE